MSTTNPEIGAKILPVHEDVIPQLNELSLNTSKPLLISDADEVILDFLGSFEKYLLTFNLKIDLSTYSLLGNIFDINSNEPVSKEEVTLHIEGFFKKHTKDISFSIGAYENLKKIENELNFQIIILTNIPVSRRQDRIHCFRKNNLEYPIIANIRSKGPTIRKIISGFKNKVFFIDDMIFNLESANTETPEVKLIHYVSDKRLAKLLKTPKKIATRAESWDEIYRYIKNEVAK
jgi:hypothetical protein|tara:strand:+ start:10435 stop:11133 length:699 start_codon:yes stop_codon:yes gene_type:complete